LATINTGDGKMGVDKYLATINTGDGKMGVGEHYLSQMWCT